MPLSPPSTINPAFRWTTSDLCDHYLGSQEVDVQVLPPEFSSFGGRSQYEGQVETASSTTGAVFVKNILQQPGRGRVLLVNGNGDPEQALLGDRLCALALENGWSGIIVNGYVRDSALLATMPVGVHALGKCPKRALTLEPAESGRHFRIGNVDVMPGLWVYADDDGVILTNRSATATA